MNDLMGQCPEVIKQSPNHVHDVFGNTTATSDGTVLKLSCYVGYRLSGYNVVKCRKGRWVPEVPACAKDDGVLAPFQSRTTNPYLVGPEAPTASPASSSGENFENVWRVTRDDMILILSICLAVAFIILVTLIICLAYYHRRRTRFYDDQKRRMTMQKIMTGRTSKGLVPVDKRHPPWMPFPPVPAIYTRPSGRPMFYPTYDPRWQHLPGRPHQLGYPFLMYHPHSNGLALEDNHYSWNTNKSNYLRKASGQNFSLRDGCGSETESIEVVWDAEHMAWLDELEYSDSKIPRPSLNADRPGGTVTSQQEPNGINGNRIPDDAPVIADEGTQTSG